MDLNNNGTNKKEKEDIKFSELLPEECWGVILDMMGDDALPIKDMMGDDNDHNLHLNNASLISKQFLAFTHSLRRKMHIHPHKLECKSRQIRRIKTDNMPLLVANLFSVPKYPNLKHLSIGWCCLNELNMDDLLTDVLSVSGLDLHEIDLHDIRSANAPSSQSWRLLGSMMKNLKVVRYRDSSNFNDGNLISIGEALPLLEELDITEVSGISDYGVEMVSAKLPRLCKFIMNFVRVVSDGSLIALSNNCKLLTHVYFHHCFHITEHGIGYMLRNSLNLNTLVLGTFQKRSVGDNEYTLTNSIAYARSLAFLSIIWPNDYCNVDEFVGSLADAKLPLQKINLWEIRPVFKSISNLYRLLGSCRPTLKRLELKSLHRNLTDETISQLCLNMNLPNLAFVRIGGSPGVTEVAFFILSKECPSLRKLGLHLTNSKPYTVAAVDHVPSSSHKNFKIRSVTCNMRPTELEMLKKIGSICPNLELLNVKESGKDEILKNGGLECVMASCPLMKWLLIDTTDDEVKGLLRQIDTSGLEIRMPGPDPMQGHISRFVT